MEIHVLGRTMRLVDDDGEEPIEPIAEILA
jgi:hypothetical protein